MTRKPRKMCGLKISFLLFLAILLGMSGLFAFQFYQKQAAYLNDLNRRRAISEKKNEEIQRNAQNALKGLEQWSPLGTGYEKEIAAAQQKQEDFSSSTSNYSDGYSGYGSYSGGYRSSSGSVRVRSYTRKNGTHVRSYTRSRGRR
ncbi:MAG: hypothetical protein HC852_24105 [Acaryochloridaceae cyanobacterium RU_4_10]|nr:hypothetical protein [Acaryochloridaceae cyanobacterium RU_4_10]